MTPLDLVNILRLEPLALSFSPQDLDGLLASLSRFARLLDRHLLDSTSSTGQIQISLHPPSLPLFPLVSSHSSPPPSLLASRRPTRPRWIPLVPLHLLVLDITPTRTRTLEEDCQLRPPYPSAPTAEERERERARIKSSALLSAEMVREDGAELPLARLREQRNRVLRASSSTRRTPRPSRTRRVSSRAPLTSPASRTDCAADCDGA